MTTIQERQDLERVVDLLAARAAENDAEAAFPYQGVEVVHEAGLAGLTVAERYGGPGAGLATAVNVLRELGRGDPSVALITASTLLLHAEQARTGRWADEPYLALLADSRRGPTPVGLLCTNPDAPPSATAESTGDGWLLTGRRIGVVGSEALSWLTFRGLTGDGDGSGAEPQLFLVPADSPGLAVDPAENHIGLRAAAAHDVVLDQVAVPADAVAAPLSEADTALSRAWRALSVAAVFVGVARSARNALIGGLGELTKGREQGGPRARPGVPPVVVGELDTRLGDAEDLLCALAERIDAAGAPGRRAVARAEATAALAVRTASEVSSLSVRTAGPEGVSRTHPLERHHRDLLCARLYLPGEEAVLAAAGRAALGA